MSCAAALEQLFSRYQQCYQTTLGEFPRLYAAGEASACILPGEQKQPVQWQAVKRLSPATFANVEQALSISLHGDINAFYGEFFAGHLQFDSLYGSGELLQVWNEQDFALLQENLIGHLLMKQQLKQPATWFVAVLSANDEMITVNNQDGSVWREVAGELPCERLADTLADFLNQLAPRVAEPAIYREEGPQAVVEHPGIVASLRRMWHNLSKR